MNIGGVFDNINTTYFNKNKKSLLPVRLKIIGRETLLSPGLKECDNQLIPIPNVFCVFNKLFLETCL